MLTLEINIASYIKSDIIRHTVIVGAGKIVDDDSLSKRCKCGILSCRNRFPMTGLECKQPIQRHGHLFIVRHHDIRCRIQYVTAIKLGRASYSIVDPIEAAVSLGVSICHSIIQPLPYFLVKKLHSPRSTAPDFNIIAPSRYRRTEEHTGIREIHKPIHLLIIRSH